MSNYPDAATRTVTCKVSIKPVGEANYFDVGKVTDYLQNNEDQTVDVPEPQKGFNTISDERITQRKRTFEITCYEFHDRNIQIIDLAKKATIITQTAGTGLTKAITAVAYGQVYYLDAWKVTDVIVQEGSIVRTRNQDYLLDTGTGAIQIIRGGAISPGVNLSVGYARPVLQRQEWIFDTQRSHRGHIRIHLFDQFDEDDVIRLEFDGNYRAQDIAPASVGTLGSFKLRMLPTGDIFENGRILT